jgi:hypothetical protein
MNSNTEKRSEEDLNFFIDQVIAELEKDARKKEVIKRLCEQSKKSELSSLLHHPVVLLVLGFFLTGFLGNILASKWQSREWDRQQSRLELARNTETKYAIINDLTKAVAESEGVKTNLVDELIDAFYHGQLIKDRDATQAKRMANWAQAKQSWILAASMLEIKVKLYFTNPEIHSKLTEMKEKKRIADDQVIALFPIYDEQPKEKLNQWRDSRGRNFPARLADTLDASKSVVEKLLKELVDLMVAETQKV